MTVRKVAVFTSAVPSICCHACGCRKAEVGTYRCEICRRREEYNESVERNIEATENGQGSEKKT